LKNYPLLKGESVGLFIRLLLCISVAGLTLYKSVDKHNELTALRLLIPLLTREVKEIHERNLELQYAINHFESPSHLMELARQPEFGHLKYPFHSDVIDFSELGGYEGPVREGEQD
jgi:hypothetical protein